MYVLIYMRTPATVFFVLGISFAKKYLVYNVSTQPLLVSLFCSPSSQSLHLPPVSSPVTVAVFPATASGISSGWLGSLW